MIMLDENINRYFPPAVKCRKIARSLEDNLLMEDVIKNLKSNPRSASDAKDEAKEIAVQGFNPYAKIADLYLQARKSVKKLLKNEFQRAKKDEDKITFSCNFIRDKMFYQPKDGILIFGIHIYMPAKKGFFAKLFTGSMGMWLGDIGVKSMREMIRVFAGDVWAKQVTKKTVFNAIGEKQNEGKTSYFFCLKIPQV